MLSDLPLMSAIKSRLQFHQARQKQLAENVANADSPGYRPRDLKPFDIAMALQSSAAHSSERGPHTTHAKHININGASGPSAAASRRASSFESTPSGNAVNLEDEMLRMSQNASDYQLAASLYSKSLGYLRIAIGKRS